MQSKDRSIQPNPPAQRPLDGAQADDRMSMNADPPSGALGLSEAEARARLQRDGPNRLPPPEHKSVAAAIASVAMQPMVLLLLACTLLYAALGSVGDSVVLGLSIVAVAAISVYQELRT